MRYVKFIKVVSFILLLSCISSLFVGCNTEKNNDLTDKEKLIVQIKQDFNNAVNDEIIEFTANPYAQLVSLSAMFSLDFKILENCIYINDVLYDSVKVINSPEISYNATLLENANELVTKDEVTTVMQKIQNSETCYMLETESTTAKAKKIAVYIVDGKYYFVNFSSSNELIRIHYTNE